MVIFTGVIAFAAILQFCVSRNQLDAMRNQYVVMDNQLKYTINSGKETAAQTDNLIRQALAQANAAEATAEATKHISERTRKQADATNDLAGQAKRSADISDNALRVTQDLADLERRPWVGFDFIDNTTKSEGYLKHRLVGSLYNTGKTPSINLEGEAFMILKYRYNSGGLNVNSIYREINKKDGRLLPTPGPIRIDKFNENEIIGLNDIGYIKVVPPNSKREFPMMQNVEFKLGGRVNNDLYNPAMIYIVGEVSYYDTSRTKKFITEFCIEKEYGADHTRFRPCPFGNDMK